MSSDETKMSAKDDRDAWCLPNGTTWAVIPWGWAARPDDAVTIYVDADLDFDPHPVRGPAGSKVLRPNYISVSGFKAMIVNNEIRDEYSVNLVLRSADEAKKLADALYAAAASNRVQG